MIFCKTIRWVATILFLTVASSSAAYESVAFDPEVHAARRATLMEAVGDGVLIVPGRYLIGSDGVTRQDPNFWYLTGVESPYSILALVRTDDDVREMLFLPERYQFASSNYPQQDARFRNAVWNQPMDRLAPGPEAIRTTGIAEIYALDEFRQRIVELVGNNKRIFYVDDDSDYYAPSGLAAPLSINQQLRQSVATLFPSASIENPLAQIMRMRRVKDEHELVRMREASRISAMSLIEAAKIIQPGINALEVAARMEYVWASEGSQGVNHARMVAAGDTSLVLYSLQYENYNNGNRIMRSGELVYIDYGIAESDMYSSDVCRTFPISGKFTPEQRKYYDIVVEVEEAALATIRPGVTMLEVVRASAAVFKKYGLEKYEDIDAMGVDKVWGIFPSPTHFLSETGTAGPDTELRVRALGHSIGLNIVAPLPSSTVLQPGMVFTVEPKLYIPKLGTGMMVEDVVVVTENGYENLSAGVPKAAADIEALMAN